MATLAAMSELVWLSAVAKDVLSASAQLLEGQVPCPPTKLAAALQKVQGREDLGLLGDAELRKDFAKALDSPDSGVQEISAQCGPQLVDLFSKVLQDKLQRIRSKAKQWETKLPKAGAASYAAVLEACKDGLPEALRLDWVLWHSVGSSHYPKDVPALPSAVVNERVALLASVGDSPIADFVVRSHVLEHLDKYQSWEASMAASQPKAPSSGVKIPFDASVTKQVTLRRALGQAFPVEVATAASEVDGDYREAIKSLAATARTSAILPKYVAPKEAAGKESGKKRKADSATSGGGLAALHKSTENQEYRWHMLAYAIRPETTLSASPSKGSKAGITKEASAAPLNGTSSQRPQGFAGVWAPTGSAAPPGHTPYSWHHQAEGMKEGFATIWAAKGSECPPGHTPYSWAKALGGTGSTPA
ncbi:unnamed protein product [Symbiodinium natans]|uniref:Uncharacterized protein n=1 Tax=Symbiodinium natans TaxID=878477 RepID=A0A812RR61_9DINO|nr:unnamed protein product [Symbiodinium natans]